MTRPGRRIYQPPAATPLDVSLAVGRLFDLWCATVEAARMGIVAQPPSAVIRTGQQQSQPGAAVPQPQSRPGAAVPQPQSRPGAAVPQPQSQPGAAVPQPQSQPRAAGPQLQRTRRRGRLIESYLRGLYGRPQLAEADLADAIRAYAADPWHRKHRDAYRTLTDWLNDDDGVEKWLAVARRGSAEQERAAEAALRRRRAGEHQADSAERQASLARRAEEELARLAAIESDRLVALERAAFESLPTGLQATVRRALSLMEVPGVANSRTIRARVLAMLAAELERTE